MPQGKRTDLVKAAQIIAMHEMGIEDGDIARKMGVAYWTVHRIVCKDSPWSELLDKPVMLEYLAQQKQIMQTKGSFYADMALNQVGKMLPEAKARDAAVVYGILRDHGRLDAGEATENVAVLHKHEIADEDELLRRIVESLK